MFRSNPLTDKKSGASVARRLSLQAVALLAGTLAIISISMALVVEGNSRTRLANAAGDKAAALADSVDAFDATARMMTERAYQPFRKKFAEHFELRELRFVPVVRAGLPWAQILEQRVRQDPQQAAQRGAPARVFPKPPEGRANLHATREVDEHAVAAGGEQALRLTEDRVWVRMRVEEVHVQHLVEVRGREGGRVRQRHALEGQVGKVLCSPLFLRQCHQRLVRVDADDREACACEE